MSTSSIPDPQLKLLGQGELVQPLPDLVEEFDLPGGRSAMGRMQIFVARYLANGRDGVDAARYAGYAPKYAHHQAHRLLNTAYVQKLLEQQTGELLARNNLDSDRVIQELFSLATTNMADFCAITEDGDVVFDFSTLTREQWAAVQELNVEEYMEGRGDTARSVKRVKFKLGPKVAALEQLGQYFQLFKKKLELTGADGTPLVPPTVNVNFTSSRQESEHEST